MSVYFAQAGGPEDAVKIGWSSNVDGRLAALRTSSPLPITLIRTMPGDRMQEKRLHRHFNSRRMNLEWFSFCPTMLTIAESDLAPIEAPALPKERRKRLARILLSPSDIEDAASELGMSVTEVCRRAGVAPSTFSRWKAGITSPTLDICHRWLAVVEPIQ